MAAKPYLTVCSGYRDAAHYLREWIEFHRMVGAERFILYNNRSTDNHRAVLAPYLENGIVTLRDWDRPHKRGQGLTQAYNMTLKRDRNDSRWIAFIDIDEFLFSPTGRPLPEVLLDYESSPAVVVNWAVFGTSGHVTKPDGLVIENFVRRTDDERLNRRVKSIVDPSRALGHRRPYGMHFFRFESGSAVDENHNPVDHWETEEVSFSKLRLNHYWTKSEEEFEWKLATWESDEMSKKRGSFRKMFEDWKGTLNEMHDDSLTPYVPELRQRLRALPSA